ncbi:MAG: hypothetical protein R2691_02475 [Solirubrobacterales bacterium]
MSAEFGSPIHYTAVERGTPVYSSDGVRVGEVRRVEDNYAEHILDGFEIVDAEGALRFVDAPEVERTFERAVTLTISAAEIAERTKPINRGIPAIGGGPGSGGLLGRLFRR